MRNILMLCVVLFSVGCKPEFPSCEKADYIIDGICIINPELNKDIIELIINKVHEYNHYSVEDKADTYEDIGVSITFDTNEVPEEADGFTYYWFDRIFRREVSITIRNRNDLWNKTCEYQSFVLIHELFHMVWWVNMGIADNNHNILGLGITDAKERNTVDYQVYTSILPELLRLCSE